jgi:hypothetical protein
MSEITVVEQGDESEATDQAKAIEVGRALEKHYPNHLWIVAFQGHALIVRHALICGFVKEFLGQDGFGFLMPNADKMTHKELAHSAMIAGGEMLEAFGYERGAWDGSEPKMPRDWSH